MNKKSIFLLICFGLYFFITGCGGNSKSSVDHQTEPILSDSAINLIPNADFEAKGDSETDIVGWVSYTANTDFFPLFERTEYPNSTNHVLHFYVDDCGNNDWDRQAIPCEFVSGTPSWLKFELKPGKEYFISLKAKSDIPGGRIHATLNIYDVLEVYVGGLVVNTTTEFKTYTKYIGVGNGEKVRFALSLGNDGVNTNNGKHFYIDDVQLLEQDKK